MGAARRGRCGAVHDQSSFAERRERVRAGNVSAHRCCPRSRCCRRLPRAWGPCETGQQPRRRRAQPTHPDRQ
ncbi:hypothetical protein ACFPRL_19990 [Pseudoclavibacter helvolus]